jgi:hypothetical protein
MKRQLIFLCFLYSFGQALTAQEMHKIIIYCDGTSTTKVQNKIDEYFNNAYDGKPIHLIVRGIFTHYQYFRGGQLRQRYKNT